MFISGAVFSDDVAVHVDVNLHAKRKSKSVLIKLANFMRNNEFAPVTIKCKVLRACLKSAILYGQETWSSSSLCKIETLFRKAIKLTFNINTRSPNEIIYMETGFYELKAEIYKAQHKFWTKIKTDIEKDPDTTVSTLFRKALDKNVQYLRHYKMLHLKFRTPEQCFSHYRESFETEMKNKITTKSTSMDSIYHEYISLNPNIVTPDFYETYKSSEPNRMIVTKYRTGSHFLHIHRGRATGTDRNERYCRCLLVQTLSHVLFDCAYTKSIQNANYPTINNLKDFFEQDLQLIAGVLLKVEKNLRLR